MHANLNDSPTSIGPGTSCGSAALPAASGQTARPTSPLVVLAHVYHPSEITYVPTGVIVRCHDAETGEWVADVESNPTGLKITRVRS